MLFSGDSFGGIPEKEISPAKRKRMAVTFSEKLYTDPALKHLENVKWRLRRQSGQLSVFVLLLEEFETDGKIRKQLSIVHNGFLKQPYYSERTVYIVGIASSKKAALGLLAQITADAVGETGNPDPADFLGRTAIWEKILFERKNREEVK